MSLKIYQILGWAGLLLGGATLASAQSGIGSTEPRPFRMEVGLGVFLVSGATPFWLRANQSGIIPLTGSTASARVGVFGNYKRQFSTDSLPKPKKLDWGYGLELVGNTGITNQILLPEAYLKGRWGQVELYAGRRRDPIGLVDTLLTSGSYAWSRNALPIPKVQLGTLGYVSLPFTKGLFAINALYNYGWFENSGKQVVNTRLHQAALYVRLGKPSWAVTFYGGLNHQVVWGGYSTALANGVSNNGYLPSSLKAYLYAVTALPASSLATDPNVSSFDETNRIGNHLGSLDVGAQITWPAGRLLVYRQNPYDTGAIFYLTTISDGLNGISFRRNRAGTRWFTVDGAVLEWLNTKSQGGSEFILDDPQRRGKVNYFNNEQFIDGWQYYGKTIGTPFLTPQAEVSTSLPIGYPIANTRVSLWHVGLTGQIARQVHWLTRLSYSQNFGTYDIPYPAGTHQFSALLAITAPVRLPAVGDCQLHSSFGLDAGKLLANSTGFYLGLRKVFTESSSQRVAKRPATSRFDQSIVRAP